MEKPGSGGSSTGVHEGFDDTDHMDDMLVDLGAVQAPIVNTFAVMKSGAKNIDSSGSSGPDDYNRTVSSENQEDLAYNELDGKALYTISGGLPHGRVPIGNGAVRKADVISAAKATNIRPSNTPSVRSVLRENAMLRCQLHVQSRQIRRTGSSHAGSQPNLASFGNSDGDANISYEGREGNISYEGRERNISCEDNYTSSMDKRNNGAS
ncbi:hypothetical protein E2562_032066 [Oryza meyeriana var. granulata]|uniref:Uncharacterized protein n=1 Tax=Oryza meyeriana var. granulata TaxID=110450 RepID=A0A6G1CJ01_9ORYZ|nr:hypothetical protein E2562_032066 [Oryza meyeriana var. granulata]